MLAQQSALPAPKADLAGETCTFAIKINLQKKSKINLANFIAFLI